MCLSHVLVLLVAITNFSHCVIVTAPVQVNQVDFTDLLINASPVDNPNQLEEVYSGLIGTDDPLPATTQDLLNSFSTPEVLANVPSGFSNLINSFAQFGFIKGSMETMDEQVPINNMVADNLNSN
eukprot:TRINITY_DN2781_c0_g1_i4.p1 TRINITY_DN2781_c0_g1~~TRINITY_DN2781_c0_g1_i4.p1  ORF type:complete len:125 (+),score=19.10 TRINITY_DN2781_c0_g1_i4:101-475(+)